jgi:hypothetical protein
MGILQFLIELYLQFLLKSREGRQSSRSQYDRPRIERLNLLEANPSIETPEAQHPVHLSSVEAEFAPSG